VHTRGNAGRNSHVSSDQKEIGGKIFILFQGFPNEKQKKNQQRKGGCATNCAFSRFDPLTLSNRPTIARVDAKKSTLCHFASWDKMGKKRSLRVRNFPFFVQV